MGTPNTPDVVKYFRYLLIAILFVIILNLASFGIQQASVPIQLLFYAVALVVTAALITLVVFTTKALGWETVWIVLSAVAMIAPCINLIVLVVINQACVKHLKAAGYKVGLMGAKQ